MDQTMKARWENYKNDSFFVGDLSWDDVMESVKRLASNVM